MNEAKPPFSVHPRDQLLADLRDEIERRDEIINSSTPLIHEMHLEAEKLRGELAAAKSLLEQREAEYCQARIDLVACERKLTSAENAAKYWEHTQVFKCPTCNGATVVERPPWVAGDVDGWTASNPMALHECVTCKGKGFVRVNTGKGGDSRD